MFGAGGRNLPRFGHTWNFAVEVERRDPDNPQLRRVDLWAARQLLTRDDPWAYVPQFCLSVERTISWLLREPKIGLPWPDLAPAENHRRLLAADDGSREPYWFPMWGPTTDNVTGNLFRRERDVIFTFEFWRPTHHIPADLGRVFVAELPEQELLLVMHEAVSYLRRNE